MEVVSSPHVEIGMGEENPARKASTITAELLWSAVAKPLTITMTMFGSYHETVEPVQNIPAKFWSNLVRCYHLLIMILLWVNFIRVVVAFWFVNPEARFDIVSLAIWTLSAAANNSIFFKICRNREMIPVVAVLLKYSFFSKQPADTEDKHNNNPTWLKHRSVSYFGAIGGVFSIVMYLVTTLLISYQSSALSDIYFRPWSASSHFAVGLLSVTLLYASALSVFPHGFFGFVCYILTDQFARLTREFVQTYEDSSRVKNANLLNSFRCRFNDLCRSVELADEMLSPFVALTYSISVVNTIFLLYQFWLHDEQDLSYYLPLTCWVTGSVAQLCLLSLVATRLHDKVNVKLSILQYFTFRYHPVSTGARQRKRSGD